MHAAFWTGAAISLLALLAAAPVPAGARPARPARRLDVVGAVLLGAGLAGLLLALGEVRDVGRGLAAALGPGRRAPSSCCAGWLGGSRGRRRRWSTSGWPAGGPPPPRTPRPLLVGLANYLLLAAIPILAQTPAAGGAGSAPPSWSPA